MNLVKASSVLYPIFGENVSDIILNYMVPTKRKSHMDKSNLRQYCIDYGIKLSFVDPAYCELSNIFGRLKEDQQKQLWMSLLESDDFDERSYSIWDFTDRWYFRNVDSLICDHSFARTQGYIGTFIENDLRDRIQNDGRFIQDCFDAFLRDLQLVLDEN